MSEFRTYLQQEFSRRVDKNPAYSLRAFAGHLKINHATLSSLLAGKRAMTKKTTVKLGQALNLSPSQIAVFAKTSKSASETSKKDTYMLLQQDTFTAMSEWYFDAILEMTLIPRFNLKPQVIAAALNINIVQAQMALETLERLQLIVKNKTGKYTLAHPNSNNCLDANYTSTANRKYQKSILEKSLAALEDVDRKKRDHTSTTLAIDTKDLPRIKEIIQIFRRDLDAFTHRSEADLNEVYQLQVSIFPLSNKDK